MNPPAIPGKPAGALAWPRSPAVLFGLTALFFAVMGTICASPRILNNRFPIVRHGEITHVLAGYLVLPLAVPFAVFALMYSAFELKDSRVFQESATRIHLVCTVLAIVEAIRVYMSWAVTTGNNSPGTITGRSFGGAVAFLGLSVAAFAWNVYTSRRTSADAG